MQLITNPSKVRGPWKKWGFRTSSKLPRRRMNYWSEKWMMYSISEISGIVRKCWRTFFANLCISIFWNEYSEIPTKTLSMSIIQLANVAHVIFSIKQIGCWTTVIWDFEVWAVQKLESNEESLKTTHTTKMCENVKRISRNSQHQMMNYSLIQRKGTAVKRPGE